MNALLLYPEFPYTFWSFKRASLPPLGLLTVAAMLPPEWAKRLVDVNVRKVRAKDLVWADLVFVSGTAVSFSIYGHHFRRTCAGLRLATTPRGHPL